MILWAEYFDCSPVTMAYLWHLQSEGGYSDDELFVLLWIARFRAVPVAEVVEVYHGCRRDLVVVVRHYRIPWSELYLDVDPSCDMPPALRRCYQAHWSRRYEIVYSASDVFSLFHFRIAVEYYGLPPRQYLRCVESGWDFRRIAVSYCTWAGRGGYTCTRAGIRNRIGRPWESASHGEWLERHERWMREQEIRDCKASVSEREREIARRERENFMREFRRRSEEAQPQGIRRRQPGGGKKRRRVLQKHGNGRGEPLRQERASPEDAGPAGVGPSPSRTLSRRHSAPADREGLGHAGPFSPAKTGIRPRSAKSLRRRKSDDPPPDASEREAMPEQGPAAGGRAVSNLPGTRNGARRDPADPPRAVASAERGPALPRSWKSLRRREPRVPPPAAGSGRKDRVEMSFLGPPGGGDLEEASNEDKAKDRREENEPEKERKKPSYRRVIRR